jgi:SAM-dependent methyltransferase
MITRKVLHVGCGQYHPQALHEVFRTPQWLEIRLDIDPAVKPDIVASLTDMHEVETASVDAVWSSHNVEHLFAHEVPLAFREFWRVLKPGGFVLLRLPDLQAAAEQVAKGNVEEPVYISPAGPICPIDMIYGYRPFHAQGNLFMLHRTGFTAQTLEKRLTEAGFSRVMVQRSDWDLWARAHR